MWRRNRGEERPAQRNQGSELSEGPPEWDSDASSWPGDNKLDHSQFYTEDHVYHNNVYR